MNILSIVSLCLLLFPESVHSQEKILVPCNDDFSSYKNGSDGTPSWHAVKGRWQIIDSGYVQQSAEYDCASILDIEPTGSYILEATFEHLSGDLGAGFIFSSYSRETIEFSQMVRFDGNGVFLMGYFQNGEFNATASTKTGSIRPATRHTLTLAVNRRTDTYDCFLDGTEVKKNVPLVFRTGYCGLQSSGGNVRFHHVKLETVSTDQRPSGLDWVKRFAPDRSGRFYLPDERKGIIKVFDKEGNFIKSIGTPASSKGQLHHPGAVCFLSDSIVAVTDHGNNSLHLFGIDGRWVNTIGSNGKNPAQFDHPSAVAVNGSREIFVADQMNNRVQIFDDSLRFISQFGDNRLCEPNDIAIQDSNVFVLNAGFCQIEWYRWNGKKAIWHKSISFGGGEGRGMALHGEYLYLSVVNEVRKYDTNGTVMGRFTGRSVNFILPWSISIDERGSLFIADFLGGRIVQTTQDLLDPHPEIRFPSPTESVIRWKSSAMFTGSLRLMLGTDSVGVFREIKPSALHEVSVDNLHPSSTYHFQFTPGILTIPSADPYSRIYAFTTPKEMGLKQYARLPMATLIFTNIIDDRKSVPGISPPAPVPSAEIDRIRAQIADGIRFYWIHSGLRLFIENETFVIDEPLKRSELYGSEWWYPPIDSMLQKYLKKNGKEISMYSGFLYLTCTQEYDTTLRTYILAGKGGGFTSGVGTGKGYGISWWDVTRANHNAGNNWLMVHEFNHQLDDIFLASGYPEYWFNHISPTIGTAAKFGEHFDANSAIIRLVEPEQWCDLQYTEIRSSADRDNDGIPDNDSRLPLDELRLGSDPASIDSDADGVTDYDELAFSNWITEGWGETYGGESHFPDLIQRDSDGDGINDREDPYPCYPFQPSIFHKGGDGLRDLAILSDRRISATVSAGWDHDSLYFCFSTDKPVPIKLMIDGNGDGWFMGRDNYLITLTPDTSSGVLLNVQIFNATDPRRWPFMDPSRSGSIQPGFHRTKNRDSHNIFLSIPINESLGFVLRENTTIGLLLGFLCPVDIDGGKRYVTIFEPNRFFDVTLVK